MLSGSSRAIRLSLKSSALFEISGWMNEVFISLRIMKVAGTVSDLLVDLKRTRAHRSKSVTAGSPTLRPNTSFTGVLPASWKSDVSSKFSEGKCQMTHSDFYSRLE